MEEEYGNMYQIQLFFLAISIFSKINVKRSMIELILKYCIQLFCYNLQNSGAKYVRNKMLRRKLQIYEVTASYKSARIKATVILIKAISLYD